MFRVLHVQEITAVSATFFLIFLENTGLILICHKLVCHLLLDEIVIVPPSLHLPRAGGRAVDLGGPSVYEGGQNWKLSTKAAVFERVSFLIGGGGQACRLGEPSPPAPSPLGAGPASTGMRKLVVI